MVYHYTKRVMLARLLANKGPAIYIVHLNRYTSMILFSSHFSVISLSQKITYLFVIGALELEWFKNAKFRQ